MSRELLENRSGILTDTFAGFELDALRGYAATFALLTPGQYIVVDARHPNDVFIPGLAPYFQVLKLAGDAYIVEVPGNDLLQPPYALTDRQEALLLALGFNPPNPDPEFPGGDPMWRYHYDYAEIPVAAALCVVLLADVFALPIVLAAPIAGAGNIGGGAEPCLHALGWHGTG